MRGNNHQPSPKPQSSSRAQRWQAGFADRAGNRCFYAQAADVDDAPIDLIQKRGMGSINFIFAHGAGAPSSHPWMQRWAVRLAKIGTVSLFDYPYMKELRKRPDPLPKLIAAHREALVRVRQRHGGPIALVGKSMGGRVGCHLALEENVAAVICLGYPLCGGGDPAKLRAEVLYRLTTPILFVQGTRDRLCPLDLLDQTRREMKAPNELYAVEGGDHSLQVEKARLRATGETQDNVDQRIMAAIGSFLAVNCAQYLAPRSV